LLIDNNTHYIVVFGIKAALTGASIAKIHTKYNLQIANLKTVNIVILLRFAQLKTI